MSAPERIWLLPNEGYQNEWARPIVASELDDESVEYTRSDAIPNAAYVAGLEAAALKMAALLSDAFDVIDAPPPSYEPEPMDVRDFRHLAYGRMKSFFDAAISIRAAIASRPASPDVRVVTVEMLTRFANAFMPFADGELELLTELRAIIAGQP